MMCYVLYAQSESTSFAQTGRTLKWSHFSTRPGLSSPNDCNVWGSGMSGDIWYLMSSALCPQSTDWTQANRVDPIAQPGLSLSNCLGPASTHRLSGSGSGIEWGSALHRPQEWPKIHKYLNYTWLWIYIDFCAWYLMVRSTLKCEWILAKDEFSIIRLSFYPPPIWKYTW